MQYKRICINFAANTNGDRNRRFKDTSRQLISVRVAATLLVVIYYSYYMLQYITLNFFPECYPLGLQSEIEDVDYEEVEVQEPSTREDYDD